MTQNTNCDEFRGPEAYKRYAPILVAIAGGKRVEWDPGDGNWTYQHPSHTMNEIKGWIHPPERYRVEGQS